MSENIVKTTINYLTTDDLCRIFDKTKMTIYNWRLNERLPYIEVTGTKQNQIRFDWDDVRRWAVLNAKTIYHEPVQTPCAPSA